VTRQAGKLGRKMGVSEIGSKFKLSDYLVDPFPNVNPDSTFDGTCGATELGMLGNDQYGCCVWAGYVHTRMLNAWLAKEQPVGNINDTSVWPTEEQVVTSYFIYEGSPGGQPDPAYDNGADIGEALLWFMDNSIGPLGPLGGFAQVNDFGEMYEGAIQTFGVIYDGILVSQEMMNEFSAGQPWSSTATDWIGGHCAPHAYRSPKVGKAATWAQFEEFTWPNWQVTREEAYVLFTPEQMKAPGGVFNGVQVAKLEADIKALKGTL